MTEIEARHLLPYCRVSIPGYDAKFHYFSAEMRLGEFVSLTAALSVTSRVPFNPGQRHGQFVAAREGNEAREIFFGENTQATFSAYGDQRDFLA